MDRRRFLLEASTTLAACAGCALCGCAGSGGATTTPGAAPVDAGPVETYQQGGVHAQFAASHGFFLVRQQGRLYAVSADCTHRRFRLGIEDGQIVCDRHGSIFDNAGVPSKGPATTPLPRFSIRLDEGQHVIVDRSRRFDQGQWGDPSASLHR